MDAQTLNEILESLKILLGVTEASDIAILTEILNDVVAEVIEARKYPSDMTEAEIQADMNKYIPNVKKLAKYDYNQIGVEYQDSHSENGISRGYTDRAKLFDGVLPYCNMF